MPGERYKTVGKLAIATGCNKETIRYYEKIGMIPPPERTDGGHRQYDSAAEKRLVFVMRTRALGFSLKQIRELLTLVDDHQYTCADVSAIANNQIDTIRSKIGDLKKMEKSLLEMRKKCSGGNAPECAIIDRLYSAVKN